jgi:hypothetical protein
VLIGKASVLTHYTAVIIGRDTWSDPRLSEVLTGEPAAADGDHVLVKTRGQVGPAEVSIWTGAMPIAGHLVFEGVLQLPDGRLCITDIGEQKNLLWKTSKVDPRVTVRVDEPGDAARVDVGLDVGDQVFPLRTAAGHPLPDLLSSTAFLVPINELGEILETYERPLNRLAAAILLMHEKLEVGPREEFLADMLAEWLRMLPGVPDRAAALALGQRVVREVSAFRGSGTDDFALALAGSTLAGTC